MVRKHVISVRYSQCHTESIQWNEMLMKNCHLVFVHDHSLCQKLDLLLSSCVRDEQKPIVFSPEAVCGTSIIIDGQFFSDIRK